MLSIKAVYTTEHRTITNVKKVADLKKDSCFRAATLFGMKTHATFYWHFKMCISGSNNTHIHVQCSMAAVFLLKLSRHVYYNYVNNSVTAWEKSLFHFNRNIQCINVCWIQNYEQLKRATILKVCYCYIYMPNFDCNKKYRSSCLLILSQLNWKCTFRRYWSTFAEYNYLSRMIAGYMIICRYYLCIRLFPLSRYARITW